MKKLITIFLTFVCLNSIFALTLPGIRKGTPVQERAVKGGKIGYVTTNKGITTEKQLIQFYNEVSKSEYKWIIIHFTEDNTAIRIIPKTFNATYGTFDKTNLTIKNESGWLTIIGNSTSKEDWPEDIFRKE